MCQKRIEGSNPSVSATNPLAFGFPAGLATETTFPCTLGGLAGRCGQPSLDLTFPSASEITRGTNKPRTDFCLPVLFSCSILSVLRQCVRAKKLVGVEELQRY